MSATQGHQVRGFYLHEDNGFKQDPTDSDPKPFGGNPSVGQAEGSNNAVRVFEFASEEAQEIIKQYFEGAWSASAQLTNPWWLNFMFGEPNTTDNGDGTYTHTWSGFDPQSQQIPLGFEPSGDVRTLKGAILATGSLSLSVQGFVQLQLSGAYATEGITSPASLTSQPPLQYTPMSFGDAALQIGGSSQVLVQDGTLNFNPNIELVYEWGEDEAVDLAGRTYEPSFDVSKIMDTGKLDDVEDLYGSAGATSPERDVDDDTMTWTIDNGVSSGSGEFVFEISMPYTKPTSTGQSGLGDPTADIVNELTRDVTQFSVSVTNETPYQ